MILTINIGNSNITIGGYQEDQLVFHAQIYSDPNCSVDEYAIKLSGLMDLYEIDPAQVEGAILGSVVPILTGRLSDALRQLCPVRVLLVGPGLKSGLPIRIDNPGELGAELLCGAVAGVAALKPPFVVINMDTAISMMGVNAQGELVGGVILPGPQLALTALIQSTAQLPQVNFRKKPAGVLATNTADSLQSGVVLSSADILDGMAARFREALGEETQFIATGTLPPTILKACRTPILYRRDLILEGLYAIWKKNRK